MRKVCLRVMGLLTAVGLVVSTPGIASAVPLETEVEWAHGYDPCLGTVVPVLGAGAFEELPAENTPADGDKSFYVGFMIGGASQCAMGLTTVSLKLPAGVEPVTDKAMYIEESRNGGPFERADNELKLIPNGDEDAVDVAYSDKGQFRSEWGALSGFVHRVHIPVRTTRALNGMQVGTPTCAAFVNDIGTCPVAQAGDTLQIFMNTGLSNDISLGLPLFATKPTDHTGAPQGGVQIAGPARLTAKAARRAIPVRLEGLTKGGSYRVEVALGKRKIAAGVVKAKQTRATVSLRPSAKLRKYLVKGKRLKVVVAGAGSARATIRLR